MSLRARVVSGLIWSGGARLAGQIVNWAITIIVVRILSPSDYGLLAMATVFTAMLGLLAEAGLGAALVQVREMTDAMLRRVFGIVIVLNSALCLMQLAIAPAIAAFYQEQRLVAIVQVLAVHFLLSIFSVIPSALLQRRLDFRTGAFTGLLSSISGSLSALGMALAGYGVWALVVGHLVSTLVMSISVNWRVRFLCRPDFTFSGMRGLVVTAGHITAARALSFINSQSDIFIAGRLLGKDLLGLYSLSLHLASLPVQKVSGLVNGIAFPAFADAQRTPAAIPGYILKAIRMLSLLSFPVLWGISSIAPEIVAVLLGPKWEGGVIPLRLLPLVMPLAMISTFLNTAFQGIGQPRVVLANTLTATLILPAAFWVGATWELAGLCMAWLFAFPIVVFLNLQRMMPLLAMKTSDVLRACAAPALAAGAMHIGVSIVRVLLSPSFPPPATMGILVATGALTYSLLTLATNRKGVRELLDLFRGQRAGGK